MRLLMHNAQNNIVLTEDRYEHVPPYVILSHIWGADSDEVTFDDIHHGKHQGKVGFAKIKFCGDQASRDGIAHFWVDTCCINKPNHTELSEAIRSMFRWYNKSVKCYVYLSDVSAPDQDTISQRSWIADFRKSRWFTRGWTLQELLAPSIVEFYSREGMLLGSKESLAPEICNITALPITAIKGASLKGFSLMERLSWLSSRTTKRVEDKAYCMQGILDIFVPIMYGEANDAMRRLKSEIERETEKRAGYISSTPHRHWAVHRSPNPLFMGREELIEELEIDIRNALSDAHASSPRRIVITGIGGQGKSELALQLARRLRNMFWAVMWVDVRNTDSAERDFLRVSKQLSLPAQDLTEACVAMSNLNHSWLFILDNADTVDIDYQVYFPENPKGVTIMTSRNEECNVYATTRTVALDGLNNVAANKLLLRTAFRMMPGLQAWSVQQVEEAGAVVQLLHAHALAITQAGAYIAQGHCGLAEYPKVFRDRRQKLLQYSPRQARSLYGSVYATFEVSAEAIRMTSSEATYDALALISLLSMCSPNSFPLVLFDEARIRALQAKPDSDQHPGLCVAWNI